MHHLVVVTGASGNVGGEVARRLLACNERVRAIGRDAGRLKPLADRGAEIATGSVEDPSFLAARVRGCRRRVRDDPRTSGHGHPRVPARGRERLRIGLGSSGVTTSCR